MPKRGFTKGLADALGIAGDAYLGGVMWNQQQGRQQEEDKRSNEYLRIALENATLAKQREQRMMEQLDFEQQKSRDSAKMDENERTMKMLNLMPETPEQRLKREEFDFKKGIEQQKLDLERAKLNRGADEKRSTITDVLGDFSADLGKREQDYLTQRRMFETSAKPRFTGPPNEYGQPTAEYPSFEGTPPDTSGLFESIYAPKLEQAQPGGAATARDYLAGTGAFPSLKPAQPTPVQKARSPQSSNLMQKGMFRAMGLSDGPQDFSQVTDADIDGMSLEQLKAYEQWLTSQK